MSTIDTNMVGMPTPYAWEITNLEARHPSGRPVMMTKVTFSTPNGLFTLFMSGDDAQQFGSQIKSKGKIASIGLALPDSEAVVGSSGIRDPFTPTGPTAPSSGASADVSG